MKYIRFGLILVFSLLAISTYILYDNNQTLKEKLSISTSNEKAFLTENSLLKNENRLFKFTVEQLNYYNDSILESMNNVRKELKIKDTELKQLQYLLSRASKKDTIQFTDTIFKESVLNTDTLIGNKWYQLELSLKYPNIIITHPTFTSEKFIIVSYKKETINPPKKCWLLRILQKKHKIVEVNVVEKNPYIESKQQKFIEIIK